MRRRWKNNNGDILEWDSLHGTVERFNSQGHHLGEYDPISGKRLSPPDPKYMVDP